MHKLLYVVFLLMFSASHAQIFITTTAKAEFFSDAPLEDITAVNQTVSSLVNTANDSVFVRIKNTGFVFQNALMKEHFNENYMESTKYPLSTFKGKINEDIDYTKEGTYQVSASGKLSIHGVEKTETIKGQLIVQKGTLRLTSQFNVHTSDFNIEIPKLVFEKLAEEIKVTFSADLKPKK